MKHLLIVFGLLTALTGYAVDPPAPVTTPTTTKEKKQELRKKIKETRAKLKEQRQEMKALHEESKGQAPTTVPSPQ